MEKSFFTPFLRFCADLRLNIREIQLRRKPAPLWENGVIALHIGVYMWRVGHPAPFLTSLSGVGFLAVSYVLFLKGRRMLVPLVAIYSDRATLPKPDATLSAVALTSVKPIVFLLFVLINFFLGFDSVLASFFNGHSCLEEFGRYRIGVQSWDQTIDHITHLSRYSNSAEPPFLQNLQFKNEALTSTLEALQGEQARFRESIIAELQRAATEQGHSLSHDEAAEYYDRVIEALREKRDPASVTFKIKR